MQIGIRHSLRSPYLPLLLGIGLFGFFLLSSHYVMSYSDPNHWIQRAESLASGEPQSRRVLLFPLYLLIWLRIAGPYWVFLANLPLLVGLAICLGHWTNRLRDEKAPPKGWLHTLSMVATVLLMFFWFRGLLLRVQNPYREAGALLLLMTGCAAFFKGDREANPLQGFLAGLLCFLSLGFRETTIVSMVPLLFWSLYRLIREGTQPRRWRWVGALALGTLLGVSPFLMQNWIYSGNPFIPAYSASHVIKVAKPVDAEERPNHENSLAKDAEKRIDFKLHRFIPGMDPRHFERIFPKTLRRSRDMAGPIGMCLLLTGLGLALWKRNRLVWGFLVPAAALNALFYGFYRYVNNRYVIIIPILLLPVAAYGLVAMLNFLQRRIRSKDSHLPSLITAWLLLMVLTGGIVHYKLLESSKLKVWEMGKFRKSIMPYLEEPREFLGYYHHREMLAWITDQEFNHHHAGSELDRGVLKENGLEKSLKMMHDDMAARMAEKALYFHHVDHTPALIPLWFKTEPVVDLSDLPVTLYHYGRPLQFHLHRIVPWDQPAVKASLQIDNPSTPTVLLLNARRIWDDPRRTRASLTAGDTLLTEKLPNDVSFWQVPAEALQEGELEITITGDQSLPDTMPMRIWLLDQDLDLNLGKQPDWWFHTLYDDAIQASAPMRPDAAMIFDKGSMTLPHFASEDRISFVEFRYEFYQEHASFQTMRETLTDGDRTWILPSRRSQARGTFRLGQGTGGLAWNTIAFTTSLPSFDEQHEMGRQYLIDDHAFVKLFDAVVFTIPGPHRDQREITLGDAQSGAYLKRGFFWKEKHAGRYPVRWTGPLAEMEIPTQAPPAGMTLELRFFDHLKEHQTPLTLTWNGVSLQPRITTEGEETVLTATLPPASFAEDDLQSLIIESPAWSPSVLHQSPDKRELGIMLHRVTLTPLPSTPTPTP